MESLLVRGLLQESVYLPAPAAGLQTPTFHPNVPSLVSAKRGSFAWKTQPTAPLILGTQYDC